MSLVIVALPKEDDPIYQLSSEKVPHLTILYLGDSENEDIITAFVQHAAKISLFRFGLDVERRGTLGPDNADVYFFLKDSWEFPKVKQFRDLLLKEPSIKTAYDSVPQYQVPQEWTPHITLGYPETPAKKIDHSPYWVQFDRIAIWSGEYTGPEFILDKHSSDPPLEVAMSDTSVQGRQFLSHHGVLGMKWGHRSETAVSSKPGTNLRGKAKVKTSGGENHLPHPDAVKVAEKHQKLKKSGIATLSNKDLQDLQTRMQLEVNVNRLDKESKGAGQKYVKKVLKEHGKEVVNRTVRDYIKTKIVPEEAPEPKKK